MPLVFFWADLAFLGADLPGVFFSSSASSASLSAFLRAASAFLAASSSLDHTKKRGTVSIPNCNVGKPVCRDVMVAWA